MIESFSFQLERGSPGLHKLYNFLYKDAKYYKKNVAQKHLMPSCLPLIPDLMDGLGGGGVKSQDLYVMKQYFCLMLSEALLP